MKKLTNAILFTAMVSGFSVAPAMVSAEEAKSERQAANAVQFRQSLLQLVRSNLGPLGAMAKGQIPYDTEVMSTNAMRLTIRIDNTVQCILTTRKLFFNFLLREYILLNIQLTKPVIDAYHMYGQ